MPDGGPVLGDGVEGAVGSGAALLPLWQTIVSLPTPPEAGLWPPALKGLSGIKGTPLPTGRQALNPPPEADLRPAGRAVPSLHSPRDSVRGGRTKVLPYER